MQTSNAKQNFGPDDLVWVLLADLSLRDFLSEHDRRDEPTAGHLFQMVRELGIPLECVGNIAMLVTEFARESPVHYKHEGLEFPGRIRIFCQKKIIDDANAARATSRPYPAEQAREHSPMILDFGSKMNGGWGCFLVERSEDFPEDRPASSSKLIDLYLYKEGK
jgi:hypothetical protein